MQRQSASPIADRVRIYADSKRLKGIATSPRRGSIPKGCASCERIARKAQRGAVDRLAVILDGITLYNLGHTLAKATRETR
jgi:hypothetical protein